MNREEIKHIANIAQIDFSDEKLNEFQDSFSETMDLIDKIKNIDTEGVERVFQVNGTENNLREDKVQQSLGQEKALSNTEEKKYGYFKLMKFID
ncbi:MAG: Asp-tRNA(Asn)/Glu-tRNA(Gln) amidotransferase subunit GatC [Tissierellia bacterium]|nr:Asp-tRNA(Asn)/Glu-tRNA(Gln) amidotransferase subunit GatC [Tissierellia bacterium]